MANIMLTETCNLRCSYCFANEYVNRSQREISLEDFRRAVFFICSGGDRTLGLIGGEPTLHSQFGKILRELSENKDLRGISLFTNGLLLNRFAEELCDEKFFILVNCNSPEIIGQSAYDHFLQNLELLIDRYDMRDRITLGVNIFRPDFRYDYLMDTLKRFDLRDVRMSLTVPNTADGRACDFEHFFLEMKPILLHFISDMLEAGIVPHYDCNKMPVCMYTQEEKEEGLRLVRAVSPDSLRRRGHSRESSILTEDAGCSPVIDILPDLTAVRCFGLSAHTREKISDFRDVNDLRRYYEAEIDAYAGRFCDKEKCRDCYLRKTRRCTAGCLAYHIQDIIALRGLVERETTFLRDKP